MSVELPIVLQQVVVQRDAVRLLNEVDLTIKAGAPTIIIGPNGSGKTTLLKVAMGLLQPDQGQVSWNGGAASLPVKRAFMFQRPVMLKRSALENVLLCIASTDVPRQQRLEFARTLLRQVGLQGFEDRPAPRLSGGERQRLALARALARQPDVLFLDEPTASLDPAATASFEALIRSIGQQGVKIVMSTHDMHEADRIGGELILLHHGQVIERGEVSKMLRQPETDSARQFFAGQLLL